MSIIDEINNLDIERKKERIQEVMNGECSLTIKKAKDGGCSIEGNGHPLTVLATLRGVEKALLAEQGIDTEMYENLLREMKIIIDNKKRG